MLGCRLPVPTEKEVAPDVPRPSTPGARLALITAARVAALALVETPQALVAPTRAPVDADWKAASREVRASFRPGDLIIAAPAWADPIMRMNLGDLLPIAAAARLDSARYGRIWEIGQRGTHVDEAAGRAVTFEQRFGALTLRRVERRPADVTYDFLERWQEAYVTRWNPATRTLSPCPWLGDRFVCPTTVSWSRSTPGSGVQSWHPRFLVRSSPSSFRP